MEDTIFAVATGVGQGAIQICRVSGDQTARVVERLTRRSLPVPRVATLRSLSDPSTGEAIDSGLVIWFPGPRSYTGEDCAEFQIHGGMAVRRALADALIRCGTRIRPAEPGEFTERAFRNGRMDLTQAEAVADLVAAQSAGQRRQALRQLEGHFGDACRVWADRLVRVLAGLEASIDFADESEVAGADGAALRDAAVLMGEVERVLADGRLGERLRDGFRVVLVGAPNAGKSSLLNHLAGREVAIVSSTPGTTRDIVEVQIEIAGLLVTLVDTAGLRQSDDAIEAEGVRRALAAAAAADLGVAVVDARCWPSIPDDVAAAIEGDDGRWIRLLSKSDLRPADPLPPGWATVSVRTGEGVDRVLAVIGERLLGDGGGGPGGCVTRARHRVALESVVAALGRALCSRDVAVRAEEVRLALTEIGWLTGAVDSEEVLDVLFRSFCLGK